MKRHTTHKALLLAGTLLGAAFTMTLPNHAFGAGPAGDDAACSGKSGHGPHAGFRRMDGGPVESFLGPALGQAKLTTAQKATLDGIQAKAEQLRQDARSRFEGVHTDISTELAKPAPDLRALSTRLEADHEQMRKSFREVSDGYLSLYDQLAPDQKQAVVAAIRTHMDEMKTRHEAWSQQKAKGKAKATSPTDEPAG